LVEATSEEGRGSRRLLLLLLRLSEHSSRLLLLLLRRLETPTGPFIFSTEKF
jgi:hypothetical protein